MKKIKDLYKYLIGIAIGIIIVGSISVYAVEAVINSKEVSYDNKESHGSYDNVQGSIDELYERSGILGKEWKDPILNGADPVFDKEGELIPVEIDGKGKVKYANLKTKWYEYEEKRWANAVILNSTGKEKNYKTGDKIDEADIESYFVWIPRYKYKIWDLGKYEKVYNFEELINSKEVAESGEDYAVRRIFGNIRVIDVIFETKNVALLKEEKIDSYYTHPAFTLGEKELNGIWVGKFEVTGSVNNISVKPGVQSLRNQSVGTFWHSLYDYKRDLDSHMLKNTEWGAVAYLSHSVYGIETEVNINNNLDYKTGYSAAANTDQSSYHGTYGTDTDSITKPWNTPTGYLASTTGNITGVYDMSGGVHEYVAAYIENYGVTSAGKVNSDLSAADLETYAKYFNKYSASSKQTSYNLRIMGDATGEMGPFYNYYDKDKNTRYHNGWYADNSNFVYSTVPWFGRGGSCTDGVIAGQFNFSCYTGGVSGFVGSRLALAF